LERLGKNGKKEVIKASHDDRCGPCPSGVKRKKEGKKKKKGVKLVRGGADVKREKTGGKSMTIRSAVKSGKPSPRLSYPDKEKGGQLKRSS